MNRKRKKNFFVERKTKGYECPNVTLYVSQTVCNFSFFLSLSCTSLHLYTRNMLLPAKCVLPLRIVHATTLLLHLVTRIRSRATFRLSAAAGLVCDLYAMLIHISLYLHVL